jgi:hypothetical protein
MRKSRLNGTNSKSDSSQEDCAKVISELKARVEALERQVYWDGMGALNRQPQPKLGRKPKLEVEELLQRRVRVTSWIEQSWPNLSVGLRRARNADEAMQAIVNAKDDGGYPSVSSSSFSSLRSAPDHTQNSRISRELLET